MGWLRNQTATGNLVEDDGALLQASARGDAAAFETLVSRHYSAVYRVVWRMMKGHVDAEDVAQEAFMKLWQNPAQVREPKALKGWLMRVSSNLAIDRLRKVPHDDLEVVENAADPKQVTGADLEMVSAQRRVDAAIASLPERQKLALTLVYFEGMGNIETARVMDVTVEAVESLLGRAKRSLRETLADDWQVLLSELAEASVN